MRVGKISDSVLKRTVLKSIGRLPEGFERPSAGKNASKYTSDRVSGDIVVGQSVTSGNYTDAVTKAIVCSANNVAAAGYVPKIINLSVILPESTEEKELRLYMEKAYEVSKALNLGIAGGHTEVMTSVSEPIFSVTCTGYEKVEKSANVNDGAAIDKLQEKSEEGILSVIMTGYAGYEGTADILCMCRDEYDKYFSHKYLRDIRQSIEEMSIVREAAVAGRHGVIAMQDIHNGGVFGGLWELSEQLKKGFSVDVRSIPIKQETVEICERVDANPYELSSMGALLIVAKDGKTLVEKLQENGIAAQIIGTVTNNNDKLLLNKDEKRFLDKPGIDEIHRIKKLKENQALCVRNY